MKKYRFKTLEEFGGKRPSSWSMIGGMDKYMGQEVDVFGVPLEEIYNTRRSFSIDNWSFMGTDIIEIGDRDTPERIPKENWGNYKITSDYIIGVEMQIGKKYFLQFNNDGVVPVNLKEHENNDYSDSPDLEDILTGSLSKLEGNKKVFKFNSMQDMIAWATS